MSVAIICLVLVVAICIAPQLDLPETTNRAFHVALLLLVSLIAVAWIVITQGFHHISHPVTNISWDDRSSFSSELHCAHSCVSRC